MNHFTREELIRSRIAQDRGIDNSPPSQVLATLDFTLAGLERVRAALGGLPMIVSSGYRCELLNTLVGGARDSQHLKGEACDFVCPALGDPRVIVGRLAPMRYMLGIDQLILEGTWVHVSFTLSPRYSVLEAVGSSTRPFQE